jgi:hypothetical protein
LTTRNKYTYNTCSSTTVNVAAASAGGNLGTAVGNSTRGIFAIGTSTANCSNAGLGTKTTNKYIYASDCSVASSCLNSFSYKRAAAGNCSRGIISTGYINCGCPCGAGPSSGRIKYTYATDVVSATACAAASNYWGAATGNSTRGIFAYGVVSGCSYSAIRNKYTYATDTNTACGVGSASSASAKGAAASWAICVNCGA